MPAIGVSNSVAFGPYERATHHFHQLRKFHQFHQLRKFRTKRVQNVAKTQAWAAPGSATFGKGFALPEHQNLKFFPALRAGFEA